jgi:hypothetical protein
MSERQRGKPEQDLPPDFFDITSSYVAILWFLLEFF